MEEPGFDALTRNDGLRDSANSCSQRLESGQFDDERVRKAVPKGYQALVFDLKQARSSKREKLLPVQKLIAADQGGYGT